MVILAGAVAGSAVGRFAIRSRQDRHNVADYHLLIVQLLLLHAAVVYIFNLYTDALIQAGQYIPVHYAGAYIRIGILVAIKRHAHTSLNSMWILVEPTMHPMPRVGNRAYLFPSGLFGGFSRNPGRI